MSHPRQESSPEAGSLQQVPPACRECQELLPWLFTGTLDRSEAERTKEHLGECEACRSDMGDVSWLLTSLDSKHVPTALLVEYGLSLPSMSAATQPIEEHISSCRLCREELALITADPSLKSSAGEMPKISRWVAALAASIAVTVGAGLFVARTSNSRHSSTTRPANEDVQGSELTTSPKDPWGGGAIFQDGFESGNLEPWVISSSDG